MNINTGIKIKIENLDEFKDKIKQLSLILKEIQEIVEKTPFLKKLIGTDL